MKVLLVNTNREKSPYTLLPLGACCVASTADSAGHAVTFLDLCFNRRPITAMESEAKRIKPDVIGLSIRNLDNCDYSKPHSYLPFAKEIVDACKRGCDAKIVLGGSAVSQSPKEVARYLDCKLTVAGEGEEAFVAMLKDIENGLQPSPANPSLINNLDKLSDPQPWKWLNLRLYGAQGASMPVQTKRGCIFNCSYCCYPQLEGHNWRLREPEWVADQIASTSKTGLRSVDFVDSVFGFPESHATDCCEAIARKQADKIPLTTLDLNPLACTPELINAMNHAGFTAVGITAESGSDTILNSLNKGFTTDDLRKAAKNLRNLQAQKLWIFMIGAPGETEITVGETKRFIEELPESDLVLITHGIRILPGTQLSANSTDNLIHPTFYYSPLVSPQRANKILTTSQFPSANMVTITDSCHKFAPAIQRIASILGARPPYWRYIPTINRARRIFHI